MLFDTHAHMDDRAFDADREELETWFPGMFLLKPTRNGSDYVYAIDDLADLKGRKFQKKRNHMNKFQQNHPEFQVLPLDEKTRAAAFCFANAWYQYRQMLDPHMDFHLEKIALERAFAFQSQLELEGPAEVLATYEI